jgi:hypothetical protein
MNRLLLRVKVGRKIYPDSDIAKGTPNMVPMTALLNMSKEWVYMGNGRIRSGVDFRRLVGSFIILEKKRTAAGVPLVPPGPGDRPQSMPGTGNSRK